MPQLSGHRTQNRSLREKKLLGRLNRSIPKKVFFFFFLKLSMLTPSCTHKSDIMSAVMILITKWIEQCPGPRLVTGWVINTQNRSEYYCNGFENHRLEIVVESKLIYYLLKQIYHSQKFVKFQSHMTIFHMSSI